MTTTTTAADLGACPVCGAPRKVATDPERPWRPDVLIDHRPGCTPAAAPLAGPGCKPHAWTALADASLPHGWTLERCTGCGVARVVRDENPEPTLEDTMTDNPTATDVRNLRRALARDGFMLKTLRGRYAGSYRVVDPRINAIVWGGEDGDTFEGVARWHAGLQEVSA
ncbi:hypothetical protein Xcel_2067 [Xylanimonas cellulosilytica DSM 15894]|uniref:Uncharacterized protein n=1 Tax=Xylanimonas cellulosilytica (strain DSM 15894 / JCM 12276 / CECT 5975 / KCTC 9989 / LMG 20990 / NBRC 107835 / XIL07) TaxID=446471 RepID=D1BU72_XYLCX|nr:hypothetical protein [Xylanimonas cellulosilytica]ACZ31085.1 hypothetical protein Xcel_2067 [Xylanimonas cellulosilytica DSM 15894]